MTNWQKKRWRRFPATLFLMLAIVCLTACGEKSIAETDSEAEANLMFDILFSSQLPVERVKTTTGDKTVWNIVIDEGWFGGKDAAFATQVLNDHGLPRPKEMLPVNNNAYGMESAEDVKKRQNREKEIQIENSIYTLPGVIRAKVIIATPANEILSLEKTLPTASITIVQTEPEPKFNIATVQTIAAGAVPNLKPENINVAVTQQIMREIPLEMLKNQRSSNMLLALGGGLIALLLVALGVIWFAVRRRQKSALTDAEQTADDAENAEFDAAGQRALEAAEADEYQ